MKVHTIVFASQTFCLILRNVISYYFAKYNDEEEWTKVCNVMKVYLPVKTISLISSILTLILFIYMTSEFSRPLTEYWQNFLLVHQTDDLEGVTIASEKYDEV